MNITDPIWRHAEAFPDRAAVYFDGREITFGRLCGYIESAAWRLAQAGIEIGRRVAVSSPNPLLHLVAILALARLGATSAAISPGSPPEAQSELARRCGIDAFLRSHAEWKIGEIAERGHLLTDGLVSNDRPPAGAIPAADDVADRPWRIGLSSGTTGAAKSFAWTHEQSSRLLLQFAYPGGVAERVLFYMDASLMFALHGLLRQLCSGGAIVIPKRLEGAEFFECVGRDRATQSVTTTANAWNLLQYAKQNAGAAIEASRKLRYFVVGGSVISAKMRTELQSRICNNLFISYGASESGNLARADPESMRQFPESAGYLLPWVEGETVDDNGAVLPKGTHGRLRFRVPACASGYEGDPAATASVFREGWFYPGDTGFIDAHGLLMLGARADDVINIGGIKIDPLVVEAVLNEDPAVRESVVIAAVTDKGAPVLIGVVVARQPIDANALRARCRERLGPQLCPAAIVGIDRLPRNAEGKILRREVMRLVRVQSAPATKRGDADEAS